MARLPPKNLSASRLSFMLSNDSPTFSRWASSWTNSGVPSMRFIERAPCWVVRIEDCENSRWVCKTGNGLCSLAIAAVELAQLPQDLDFDRSTHGPEACLHALP